MKKNYSPALLILFITSCMFNSLSAHEILTKPAFRNFDSINVNYKVAAAIERHRVWLNLTNKEGIFRQILMGYMQGATNGFDYSYDAISMDANKYADFFSINEGKKLVIQARGLPFSIDDTVPLGYRSAIEGDLTISIDHADGDLANQEIYLEDAQSGNIHNLKESPYTFSTEKGIFLNRFIIRYSPKTNLATDEFSIKNGNLTVFSNNNIITLKSYDQEMEKVLVFDLSGRLIFNSQKVNSFDLKLDKIQPSKQLLLIKVAFEGGSEAVKKILF